MAATRPPLVIAAAVVLVVALAIELGSRLWVGSAMGVPQNTPRPGLGIPSLAAVDVMLAVTLATVAASSITDRHDVVARANGCIMTVISFLSLLASIGMLFVAITLLLLMVGLLVATPFGTIAYLAVWGDFPRGGAAITLGILMVLKLIAAGLEFLGNQDTLKSKILIALFLTSIGLTFVLTFLHGLPPGILVSITDTIGAIIALICGIIWAIIYLVGGITGIIGNLNFSWKKRR